MNSILLVSTSNDGIVVFSIHNKRYRYYIDAALIPYIVKVAERKSGKALNFVKKRGELLK